MPRKSSGLYRGWLVVAAAITVAMLMFGPTLYCFGFYFLPAAKDLGISRTEASDAMVALLLGTAIWGPISGGFIDRLSPKTIMSAGCVLGALGYLIVSQAKSLWLIGLAVAGPVAVGALWG